MVPRDGGPDREDAVIGRDILEFQRTGRAQPTGQKADRRPRSGSRRLLYPSQARQSPAAWNMIASAISRIPTPRLSRIAKTIGS